MMKQEKITRDELLAMKVGEKRTFQMTRPEACQTARVTVGQLKGLNKGSWEVHCTIEMKQRGEVEITRIA